MHDLTKQPTLSVVIPVFQAAAHLHILYERLSQAFAGISYELIMVDDGSTDDTWEVLKRISAACHPLQDGRLRCIGLPKNVGQYTATFLGLSHATGRYLATMDDDLQQTPEQLKQLLNLIQTKDVEAIYGIYYKERLWGSIGLEVLLRATAGWKNGASAFRVLSADLFAQLQTKTCDYLFIDGLIAQTTRNILCIPVQRYPRIHGKSGFCLLQRCCMAIRILYSFSFFFPVLSGIISLLLLAYGTPVASIAATVIVAGSLWSILYKRTRQIPVKAHINKLHYRKIDTATNLCT